MSKTKPNTSDIIGRKTEKSFLTALRSVAGKAMTSKELEGQRLSFISGSIPSDQKISRKKITTVLKRIDGTKVA